MPVPKRNLNRVGICAYPDDAGGVIVPLASYEALTMKNVTGLPTGALVVVVVDGAWLAEWWQLRAISEPVAPDAEGGCLPSADATRAWFRAS